MKKLLIAFCALFVGWASTSLAAKTISVTVTVDKSVTEKVRVFGTGFSVNNKSKGSMGSSTSKTGPANAKYSFGFRVAGKDVSCGSAVLTRDSKVLLYYQGSKCVNKVFPK